jgi:hypothetical protein
MRTAIVHAAIAFLLAVVFGLFLRIIAIAALLNGGFLIPVTALVVVLAALGFGALGRAFTGRKIGWLHAATVILWAPAVLGTAFFIFSDNGSFQQINPAPLLIGGVAGAAAAVLGHPGPPRVIGIIALLAAAAALATSLFITF